MEAGAEVGPVRESTELKSHLRWLANHRSSLLAQSGQGEVIRLERHLTDPLARSVLLATVGPPDDRDEYFTVALDPSAERVVCCLALRRGLPRRLPGRANR